MVLYGMFSQPYIQYPVRARVYMRSRLSLLILHIFCIWESIAIVENGQDRVKMHVIECEGEHYRYSGFFINLWPGI